VRRGWYFFAQIFNFNLIKEMSLRFSGCLLCVIVVLTGCKSDSDSVTISDAGLAPPGVNANSFLAANAYDQLVIEVQYVTGFAPSQQAVNNLTGLLQGYLNKPVGISVEQKAVSSPGKANYSLADIKDFESHNRTQLTKDKKLTAYVFFADGDYAETASSSSKVLGIAYRSGSIVIFEKTIKSFSGGLTQPPTATLESIVMEHEFGHLLGLVNNGSNMQTAHQDTANGKHCSNQNCLMYYLAETSDVVANITGGNVPPLDSNCINDLKANGGK
jgi:predicted Zn-dependent protease